MKEKEPTLYEKVFLRIKNSRVGVFILITFSIVSAIIALIVGGDKVWKVIWPNENTHITQVDSPKIEVTPSLPQLPEKVKSEAKKKNKPVNKIKVYYDIVLVLNAAMSKGEISIDGKPAQILDNQILVKTIRVLKKEDAHTIRIEAGDKICKKTTLITYNRQEIILCD